MANMETLTYPENIANRNGFVRIIGMDSKQATKNVNVPTTGNIELPLPLSGLQYKDGMNYDNTDFGMFRNAAITGLDKGALDQLMENALDTFNNMGDASVRRDAIASISAMMGVGVGKVNSRTTPNPNSRSVFKSPSIRDFSFSWKLNPVTVQEAENIEKIIKTLRTEMYPKRMFPGQETRIGYRFPSIWNISVFIGAGEAKEVEPKIKPCWLTGMETNLGVNGVIMAKSGDDYNFAETTISLSFQEEIALTSEDITAAEPSQRGVTDGF
jgi:hypothetical protein